MLSCFSPPEPCSLHPLHRITRDAGVSIATAVQAVAIGLWWGLVAVMCLSEYMWGCLRVSVRERHGKRGKTKRFECMSIFRLTTYSSWLVCIQNRYTVTFLHLWKGKQVQWLFLTVCQWWADCKLKGLWVWY